MAQATHGSAPDISGKHIANPYAMIMSGQMMLQWLGMRRGDAAMVACAAEIEAAVSGVLEERQFVTADLGGSSSTEQMGEAICRKLAAK